MGLQGRWENWVEGSSTRKTTPTCTLDTGSPTGVYMHARTQNHPYPLKGRASWPACGQVSIRDTQGNTAFTALG